MTKQQLKNKAGLEAFKRANKYQSNQEYYDFLINVYSTLQGIQLECLDELNTVMPQVFNNRMVKDQEYANNHFHNLFPITESASISDELISNNKEVWNFLKKAFEYEK